MNLKFLNLESVSCPSSEYMKVEMMSASEYRSAFSAVSGSLRNLMSCPCASLSKASRSHSSISKTASFIADSLLGINYQIRCHISRKNFHYYPPFVFYKHYTNPALREP